MKQNKIITTQQSQVAMLYRMTGSGKTTFATKLKSELPAICCSISLVSREGKQINYNCIMQPNCCYFMPCEILMASTA